MRYAARRGRAAFACLCGFSCRATSKEEGQQPHDDGSADAVNEHRAGYVEHLRGNAHHIALGFKLNGGRDDGVGKTRDRNHGASARVGADFVIDAEAGQECAEKDHDDGRACGQRILRKRAPAFQRVRHKLPDYADQAACPECVDAVAERFALWHALVDLRTVLFCVKVFHFLLPRFARRVVCPAPCFPVRRDVFPAAAVQQRAGAFQPILPHIALRDPLQK